MQRITSRAFSTTSALFTCSERNRTVYLKLRNQIRDLRHEVVSETLKFKALEKSYFEMMNTNKRLMTSNDELQQYLDEALHANRQINSAYEDQLDANNVLEQQLTKQKCLVNKLNVELKRNSSTCVLP